jgi:multidrug efflux pump
VSFSEIFIRRPVATTLLAVGLALSGLAAFGLLPVSPMPEVDFPTISVSASLPGASPETMSSAVATPLERRLGKIAGVTEMTSTSSLGFTRIVLQFELNRSIDGAGRDVQAAINASLNELPDNLPRNPVYRKVNPADAPIMILSMTSTVFDRGQMYDAASTVIAQRLSQISGVGEVRVGGSSLPAVRVALNPQALSKYQIGFEQVSAAISAATATRPKGSIEDRQRHWQIDTNDPGRRADEFLPLVVAYRDGAPIRVSDLADVLDSVQDLRNEGTTNGQPSILVMVFREPGANIIDVVDRVTDLLAELRQSIPGAMELNVAMHSTSTIRTSLREMESALLVAIALVVLVALLFLRNLRATLIPGVVVPLSIIGTFGVMYLCGFSLNNLSLMALTIAAGFVVDDAFVVLENVSRRIESGMKPIEAAMVGTREVGFTVLAMSISLIAVFIPVLFMGGLVGRVFREFAITLSVAIVISMILSLTLTPMMCARLPSRESSRSMRRSLWLRVGDRVSIWVLRQYRGSLVWCLHHPRTIMFFLASTIGLTIYLYIIIPKGFFPQQDTGRLIGTLVADQGISFQALREKLFQARDIVRADPAVDTVVAFTGGGQRNIGGMFIALKPLKERKASAGQVLSRLRNQLARQAGARLFLRSAADVRVGGRPSSAQYQYTLQSDDVEELRTWTPRLEQALNELPELADVNSDLQDKGLQTNLVVDNVAARRLGLTSRTIVSALHGAFGQRPIATIYDAQNQYFVVMEVAAQYQQGPEALEKIYVRTPTGNLVPLSAFSRYDTTATMLAVNHQAGFAASTLSFNLEPGVSLSEAVAAVAEASNRIGTPSSVYGSFQGTARAYHLSVATQPWLILAALLTMYIVLGMLYESYLHPITILSTLPSAGVGALLALLAFKVEFNVVGLIGVLLLIGIVKKNAIMMIDFALETQRKHGSTPEAAITQACLLRFRPIMMTTMAALFGAVPLVTGFGEGSELRRPLGIAIIGGLLLSQVLTLYTTPVVYLCLDRARSWALRAGFARLGSTPR